MLNYDEYLEVIKKRRAIREFTDKTVSDDYIKKIIDAARYAPSAMNYQPWEFVVVKDQKVIEEITTLQDKNMKIQQGTSVLIIVIGDMRKQINLEGQNYSYNNGKIKLEKANGMVDVNGLFYSSMANAFLQMITAATSLGLGSQYVTLIASPMQEEFVKEKLKIPQYMKIYDAAAIGYPAYEPKKKFMRNLKDIIHFEQYDSSKSWTDEYIVERAKKKLDMNLV